MADNTITADVAAGKLRELARRVPALRRALGEEIKNEVIRRGLAQIIGGTLKANGPNRKLGQYFAAAMRANVSETGDTYLTGLPPEQEEARILAHRNFGGTITAKNDRPNPHLRIPLPPALTPAGFDRYAGVRLRDLIGKGNPFVLLRTGEGTRSFTARGPSRTGVKRVVDKTGKAVLALKNADGSPGKPWYVLKKSVTNRAFPWWDKAKAEVDASMPALLDRVLAKFNATGGK